MRKKWALKLGLWSVTRAIMIYCFLIYLILHRLYSIPVVVITNHTQRFVWSKKTIPSKKLILIGALSTLFESLFKRWAVVRTRCSFEGGRLKTRSYLIYSLNTICTFLKIPHCHFWRGCSYLCKICYGLSLIIFFRQGSNMSNFFQTYFLN